MTVTTGGHAPQPAPLGALQPTLPVWGLFGRTLLLALGNLVIIPAPWTVTSFYRFLADHVALPDGRRLKFTGQPADIWYVLVAIAAVPWIHGSAEYAGFSRHLGMVWMIALAALTVPVLQWFCANLKSQDDTLTLSFEGGYWPYIGWSILLGVSFITIVGWAWVIRYMMRWICLNVRGTIGFDFTAPGLAILWRTVVAALLSVLIIPIPWVHRWLANWFIAQISVTQPGGRPAP